MLSEDYTKGYVSGFIDADGSFSVSIKVQRDVRYGVRIDPVFSVTQRNREVLEFLRRALGCGRIIKKPGQENLWLYIVDRGA
ncbi:MAG: rRNA intron-encoded endonuclease [Candidatus Bathyarchaeota archaeon B24]|nr:MAG: rRNA intron-encoded endonuclease [Candidatus Bathyarchaeota archaeon B24]